MKPDLSIAQKLLAQSLLGLTFVGVVGITGYGAATRLASGAEQIATSGSALKNQLQAAHEQLEVADFKALYYATLLRVAEEELGIDIEKKFVTKPSASC